MISLGNMSQALEALDRDLKQGVDAERVGSIRGSTRSAGGRHAPDREQIPLRPEDAVDASIEIELPIRRSLLAELGGPKEILRAAVQRAAPDPVSRAVVSILSEDSWRDFKRASERLGSLSRSDLSAYAVVARWLENLVPNLPSQEVIQERIAVADLRAPLEKLVAGGFVGRVAELRTLDDYVDVVAATGVVGHFTRVLERARRIFRHSPPIVISGPGGVGKSTLLAQFILRHLDAQRERKFPFIYLDFDRAGVRARDPAPALVELIRQISVQFPSMADEAEEWMQSLQKGMRSHDSTESARDIRDLGFEIRNISTMLSRHVPSNTVILVVMDTFEELQYLGETVVASFLDVVGYLYSKLPNMRLVLSGRNPIADELIVTTDIILEGFEKDEAATFLQRYVERTVGHVDEPLADLVRELALAATRGSDATPLTLVLAGDALVRSYSGRSVDSPDKLLRFVRKLKKQQIQEGLFGRILEHLHDHELRKIAHPGLVLRRIDADILMHVLAPSRNLRLRDRAHAEELVSKLAEEGALVEIDPRGGVRHRPDVRKLMLRDMTAVERRQCRVIEERAADYYRRISTNEDPELLAERIYHLMRLEIEPADLEREWRPGVAPYLANALDEVPATQSGWLAGKLDVQIGKQTQGSVSQSVWELDTEGAVRHLLAIGTDDAYLRAEKLLLERPVSSWTGVPIYMVAAETFVASGRFHEALQMLRRVEAIGNPDIEAKVALLRAQALEALGEMDHALEQLRRAEEVRGRIDPLVELRLLMARIRVSTAVDSDPAELTRDRNAALILLQTQPPHFLQGAPALLRDAASEFGAVHQPLLKLAMRTLGLQLIDNVVIDVAIEAILEWDGWLEDKESGGQSSEQPASIVSELTGDRSVDLLEWFRANRSRVADQILKLWNRHGMPAHVRRKFADLYGDVSRRSILRSVNFA